MISKEKKIGFNKISFGKVFLFFLGVFSTFFVSVSAQDSCNSLTKTFGPVDVWNNPGDNGIKEFCAPCGYSNWKVTSYKSRNGKQPSGKPLEIYDANNKWQILYYNACDNGTWVKAKYDKDRCIFSADIRSDEDCLGNARPATSDPYYDIAVEFIGEGACTTSSSSIVDAAHCNNRITCHQDCTHTRTDYEGDITLNLVCDETSGSSITGTLIVNGEEDSKTVYCQVCGNGTVESPEACDLGEYTANGIGGCAADCMSVEEGFDCSVVETLADGELTCRTICGDGILKGFEQCDDEIPAEDGDGCSENCEIEDRWTCDTPYGETSTCYPGEFCGNGKIGSNETCDDGVFTLNPFDSVDPVSGDGCSATCQIEYGYGCEGEPSECTLLSICGDGHVDSDEVCDDGDTINGGTCSADCQTEYVVTSGEACTSPGGRSFFSGQPWHNGDVEVVFTCDSDNGGSGCMESCGEVPNRHIFAANDDASVTLCGSDLAGNHLLQEVSVNWIDKEAPQINIGSFKCVAADEQDYNGEWINQDVSCSFVVEDLGDSGLTQFEALEIAQLEESVTFQDDMNVIKKTINWRFSLEGEAPFTKASVEVIDCANNTNTLANKQFLRSFPGVFIDKTSPVFERLECLSRGMEYVGAAHVPDFSNGWTNAPVNCGYRIADPNPTYNAELKQWKSTATAVDGTGAEESWIIDETGKVDVVQRNYFFTKEQSRNYEFNSRAEDHAKNVVSRSSTIPVKIDTTTPTLSPITCTSEGLPYPDDSLFLNGWTREPVTCSYAVDDPNHSYNSKLREWGHDMNSSGAGHEDSWGGDPSHCVASCECAKTTPEDRSCPDGCGGICSGEVLMGLNCSGEDLHLENSACVPNARIRTDVIENGTCTETWNDDTWGPCVVTECHNGFHEERSTCVLIPRS